MKRAKQLEARRSRELPPSHELFDIRELAARHPHFLSDSRIRWALRNRFRNGLASVDAVFQSRSGQLLIREPAFISWWLRLDGRSKPRASRHS